MPEPDHHAYERDAHDPDRVHGARTAADLGDHRVHTHPDGTTHTHSHDPARRPGFLARLFGAPG